MKLAGITAIRIVGSDERFEVGKSWDSRGAVQSIENLGPRDFAIIYANGATEHLVNCPVIVRYNAPQVGDREGGGKSYSDMPYMELKAKAKEAGIDISDISGKGSNERIVARLEGTSSAPSPVGQAIGGEQE